MPETTPLATLALERHGDRMEITIECAAGNERAMGVGLRVMSWYGLRRSPYLNSEGLDLVGAHRIMERTLADARRGGWTLCRWSAIPSIGDLHSAIGAGRRTEAPTPLRTLAETLFA